MIPQEKSAAVTRGLNETFGVTEFEDIRDLTERPGSNRAFRIIVRGSAIPAADQHAPRRYGTSLHLHAGGGRCGLGAACQVCQ